MTGAARYVLGGVFAVAVTAGVGALSQVPYRAEASRDPLVRLTWRARGIRVEDCLQVPPEELEKLPVHMRRAEECVGRILPYRLTVTIDGGRAVDETVEAGGARADRPLFVFREISVSPGRHALDVTFRVEGEVPSDAVVQDATPRFLELDATVDLEADRVVLVTYDAEHRELVLRGYGADRRAAGSGAR